jgi:D-xylulose 5-phosphate/D-fructose 6-phosphate phosphoketolase
MLKIHLWPRQGFLQGYTLTGRTGLLPSYEAFLSIVDTMILQFVSHWRATCQLSSNIDSWANGVNRQSLSKSPRRRSGDRSQHLSTTSRHLHFGDRVCGLAFEEAVSIKS